MTEISVKEMNVRSALAASSSKAVRGSAERIVAEKSQRHRCDR